MTLVDAHAHVSDVWYEPAEALLAQMDRHGVGAAVLIQLLGQFHNEYQQGCLRRFPGRFASVVAVDPAAEGALAALDALARDGATGLRLRPISRSPGADPLAIWRRALRPDGIRIGTEWALDGTARAECTRGHPPGNGVLRTR